MLLPVVAKTCCACTPEAISMTAPTNEKQTNRRWDLKRVFIDKANNLILYHKLRVESNLIQRIWLDLPCAFQHGHDGQERVAFSSQ